MEFNKKGKILLAIGTVVILLASVLFYFMIFNKDYERVFSDLPPEQLSKVATSLEEAGLKFEYPEAGSGLLIEKSRLAQARIQLSKDRVFQSEISGLEIFGEAQHAMSDFYQRINYQRALQGELERSILTISGVEAARVHLAIPREKSFSRKETDVKAAVTLTVANDDTINARDIVHTVKQLVASSVIDLKAANVSVLDSTGQILGAGGEMGVGINEALTLKQEIEHSIEKKVRQLLSPYYDVFDIGISSWATVNNDQISETSEGLDASESPVVLKRTTETTQGTKKSAESTVMNEEFSYKSVTRAVDYQKGTLERMTVSVMVPSSDHFTHEVLHELLSNALGIDDTRGDKLSVVFVPKRPEAESIEVLSVTPNEVPYSPNSLNPVDAAVGQGTLNSEMSGTSLLKSVEVISAISVSVFMLVVFQFFLYRRRTALSVVEEKQIMKDVHVWLEGKTIEQDVKL
ncbi:flagellar basal-body MS-ring/collar protein FliF [Enterovibrio norvegicus]|uniref:Flagellar M-ring protein n=1 Tax=Enterovibrio norvegicus TaxID=188144 RepID=A0ABV4L4C8_9GAMM|nr:flagellar basal-body MS-ring/collar protein FliF [Enterovibrio norvegicus]OEF55553.1 flagellar M-ring protein FliF [Enterovibrio norvegicus]